MIVWEREPLGKHAYIRARIGWRGLSSAEYLEEGPCLIAGHHIKKGRVSWDECDHVSSERYVESPEIALKSGDVIISKDGTIGRVARIDNLPSPATLNGTMMLVRPKKSLDYRFLFHLLGGHSFQKLISDKISGSSIPHLFQRDISELAVHLPPIEEQARIAAVLDVIDGAIAKTEAVIVKLNQVRMGLLHDLLTRGLDKNGQLRDPIVHPEQFTDSPIGRIPRAWDVKPLGALLTNQPNAMRSGPFGSALLKQELKESGIPLLGIDNVHVEEFIPHFTRFVTEDKYLELKRYSVRPKDVMITVMGTVGRCCVVPEGIGTALSSKHVWTISLDQSRYSSDVACWQINYATWVLRQFGRDEQGGVMTAIRSDTLRQLLLPVPVFDEMKAIERTLFQSTGRIRTEAASLSKLTLIKAGLMSDLLAGRVRVPEEMWETDKG